MSQPACPRLKRSRVAAGRRPIPASVNMQALTFWKTISMDESNLLEQLIAELAENGIRYCVSAARQSMPMSSRWSAWT